MKAERIEFDTLAMTAQLRAAGFSEAKASAVVYAIKDIAMSNVATKNDVTNAVHTMTVRLGGIIGFAMTALGVLIAFK